jgi:hypothetical protein
VLVNNQRRPRGAVLDPPRGWRTLQTVAAVVALVASVVLAGCGTSGSPPITVAPMSTPANTSATRNLIMIIRHGEKPDGSHPGIDSNGNPDDSSLTAIGWDRAHRLVGLFAPAQGPPRTGLARPIAIYAAAANTNGEGKRTRETVQPLADALGITVNTTFGNGEENALAQELIAHPAVTLICWQHGEIPAIVKAFPAVSPRPPSTWPNGRFDVIWTLTQAPDGWHFAQLPELALPKDQASVIPG